MAQTLSKIRLSKQIIETEADIRCPHCNVVILRRERINPAADRGGAPEFCPRCGERTGDEPPPVAGS